MVYKAPEGAGGEEKGGKDSTDDDFDEDEGETAPWVVVMQTKVVMIHEKERSYLEKLERL